MRLTDGIGAECGLWLLSALLIAVPYLSLAEPFSITPASMVRIGTVDERYQSYNVEMVEVTGGRFWKPYGSQTSGGNSDLYQYRPPIDLTAPRLRMHLLSPFRQCAIRAAYRFQRSSQPAAMARSG